MGETRRKFSREFKIEAVRLVTEGGQTIAETARELGINTNLLGRWKQQLTENGEQAFPGKGRMINAGPATSRSSGRSRAGCTWP